MQKKSGNQKFIIIGAAVILAALALLSTFGKNKNKIRMTKGKTLPEIILLYNTSEDHKLIAEAIQEMWKKELGADVKLYNKEWKVYLKDTQSLNYNVARAGWIADYPDPNTFLDMWLTGGGNNQTGWSDKWYDKQIDSANLELDPAKRMKMLAEAEDYLINKGMPILPIYFYVNRNILRSNVKGFYFNLRDVSPMKQIWIEKNGKPAPPAEQVFRFNNSSEPETIDPALMTGNIEFTIAQQLYEGLLSYDPETLVPIPGVAEKWEMSPDGLVYTFHLRKNARWSNGDPVTAHDFVYSWIRALEPTTAADYAYQLYYLKNGKAFSKGEIKDPSLVGIKALDDYTLQTTLERPTAYWLDLTAFHTLMPVNKKCVEKSGDKWTRPENIVTNGPFKLVDWEPKKNITMVKNPDYWDAKSVIIQKLIANPIENDITSVRMFEANETDWVRIVPAPQIDKWKKRPEAHFTPFLTTYYYRFNVTKPPFNDFRVRMAFNLAVNKQLICDKILKAGQKPATTFVPPGIRGYTSPKGPEYNPEKARKLLQDAGYAVTLQKKAKSSK